VAKEYRGMGLVQKMYAQFKESYHNKYQYCITDVAADNPRSLKTHIKTGFEIIDTKTYGGISWDIILWSW
jgi:L-amino acid N-acyltransferase YncA